MALEVRMELRSVMAVVYHVSFSVPCVVQLLEISYRYDIVISVAEFYAPRYGAVDADPSLPDQKLTLNWVYPFTVSHRVAVAFQ